MNIKAVLLSVFCLLASAGFGYWLGSFSGESGAEAGAETDWLTESKEPRATDKEVMELRGQVMLLKKMLGEIDGHVVLLGPVGPTPVARGRLVWDAARMQGFLHAVHLPTEPAAWTLDIRYEGKTVASCPLPSPKAGVIQSVFRPGQRVLQWDRFVVSRRENETVEEVLVGIR